MLGGVYGDSKHQNTQTTQQMLRFLSGNGVSGLGVFLLLNPPSERAEQRSAPKGCRAPPVRARSAFLSARRVRRALGGASSAGHRAVCARRSDRGVFLLVAFLCTSKEKLPAVGQPPTSSFSDHRRKAIRPRAVMGRGHGES